MQINEIKYEMEMALLNASLNAKNHGFSIRVEANVE